MQFSATMSDSGAVNWDMHTVVGDDHGLLDRVTAANVQVLHSNPAGPADPDVAMAATREASLQTVSERRDPERFNMLWQRHCQIPTQNRPDPTR